MTKLLRSLLRKDYLSFVKAKMLDYHWNNTTLSKKTGFSRAHIGNVLAGNGSDDALAAVCKVLDIDVRSLFEGFKLEELNINIQARPNNSDQVGGTGLSKAS